MPDRAWKVTDTKVTDTKVTDTKVTDTWAGLEEGQLGCGAGGGVTRGVWKTGRGWADGQTAAGGGWADEQTGTF